MSDDIKQNIRDLSQKVSEDYIFLKKDMNENLISMIKEGQIGNGEILKRVCEQANQNVYLSLFNNEETNRANIVFDIADSEKISSVSKDNEEKMKNYDIPPKDFRSTMEIVINPNIEKQSSEFQKLADFGKVLEYRQVYKNFLSGIERMKTAELMNAEEAINYMSRDATVMVSHGERIGDIAKIAVRFVKEKMGGDFIKVAACYELINKELKEKGFNSKDGFTKISSYRINEKSEILKPVKDFAESIAKLSGLIEMEGTVKSRISACSKIINKNKL